MNEKKYEKKVEFQQKVISRQAKQIEELELQIRNLRLEIEEKNKIINSTASLRDEMAKNVEEVKGYKKQYKELIDELRMMKDGINKEVYKGRWKLVKFLIK